VRLAAAWALGEIESPDAIPPLVEALARDEEAQVREAAAWALGEIE
jgi:HEAT repeat protein